MSPRTAGPSTPVGPAALAATCRLVERLFDEVQPTQLGWPTPCALWTVADVMEHIVASTDFFADAAANGAVADDRPWPSYAPADLPDALRHHDARLLAAFRDPRALDRPIVLPAGPGTAQLALEIAVSEQLVHAWDLAAAIGARVPEEYDPVAASLLGSATYVVVNDEVRAASDAPLGPARAVGPDARPLDRLVAFLGRDPAFRTARGGHPPLR